MKIFFCAFLVVLSLNTLVSAQSTLYLRDTGDSPWNGTPASETPSSPPKSSGWNTTQNFWGSHTYNGYRLGGQGASNVTFADVPNATLELKCSERFVSMPLDAQTLNAQHTWTVAAGWNKNHSLDRHFADFFYAAGCYNNHCYYFQES